MNTTPFCVGTQTLVPKHYYKVKNTRSRPCTWAPALFPNSSEGTWKKGVLTLVSSEYRAWAPCPGTKCKHCLILLSSRWHTLPSIKTLTCSVYQYLYCFDYLNRLNIGSLEVPRIPWRIPPSKPQMTSSETGMDSLLSFKLDVPSVFHSHACSYAISQQHGADHLDPLLSLANLFLCTVKPR